MSDHESSDELAVLDDAAVNKHKMAADVVNSVLMELVKLSVVGAKIVDLCVHGDQRITEESSKLFKKDKNVKKGIAFPTCVSVNNLICHYSPIEGEEEGPTMLMDSDVVKIDVGAHIDGFAAIVGHTFVVGASPSNKVSGRKADVIQAAEAAAETALRLFRPGNENTKVSELICKAAGDFNCHVVEGMQSLQLRRMSYGSDKSVVLNPTEDHRRTAEKFCFEVNEVWDVDILVSTGDGKPREHSTRTSLYKKCETVYQLKMKTSRQLYGDITNNFAVYPFNIRALEDIKRARLGITECVKHDMVQPFPVYCEKDDDIVAQIRFTVLMMPNGPMRITGPAFESQLYKSEFKIRDPDVKDLLSQPIKTQSKKKKAAKNPAGDKKED